MTDQERKKLLREQRNHLLKKIGLPPDTPPAEVRAWFEKQEKLRQDPRYMYFKETREQVLDNLGLPKDTPAGDVLPLLQVKEMIAKIGAIATGGKKENDKE